MVYDPNDAALRMVGLAGSSAYNSSYAIIFFDFGPDAYPRVPQLRHDGRLHERGGGRGV